MALLNRGLSRAVGEEAAIGEKHRQGQFDCCVYCNETSPDNTEVV